MTAGLKYMLSAGGLAALAGGWIAVYADFLPPLPALRVEQAAVFAGQPPGIPAFALPEEAPAEVAPEEKRETLRLSSVEGIKLDDSIMELIRKKGQPVAIRSDPRLSDLEVYDYGAMDVAFRGGDLLYVEVGAEAEAVQIDGIPHSFDPEALRETLGEPDFAAEDGWGYKRGFGAIKFYTDPATGQIRSVHYFDAVGI
ncbi:hypothetical protein [Paenibacillus sp. YN15]|uniref:hypothetical protein n=1 Tax=Paenibacillus sp. YN15 TaxID=1742774 RepID=UPI000DCB7F3A|nr:hypothetical protein [Paenibacillus sp. YN15]RAV02313.1 hypothetical protein DQG13_09780 [Paenibacillus sp. YN15]